MGWGDKNSQKMAFFVLPYKNHQFMVFLYENIFIALQEKIEFIEIFEVFYFGRRPGGIVWREDLLHLFMLRQLSF